MKSRTRGFSLTELMVATALLATATAGGLTALASARGAEREAAALQQLHERAQYVLATLEVDLQMAGYFAGDAPATALPVSELPRAALRCGEWVPRELQEPLQVSSSWILPCAANGGGARAGSDILTVRRLSARQASSPERGRAQWLSHATRSGQGRLYWQGEAPWHDGHTTPGTELRELLINIYYVARTADGNDGIPALRVKTLTSIAGTPAFVDTEVMSGVENLQVELLPAGAGARQARVQLQVVADEASGRPSEGPRRRQVTRLFALRNASP